MSNPEFKAYGSSRMQWLEDWRTDYSASTPCHHVKYDSGRPVVDCNGWYLDNFQHETVHGVVLTMPAQPDCDNEEYRAAVADPWNDGAVCVDLEDTFEDIDDAARAANDLAERYAEDAREHDAKDLAEGRIETAIVDIAAARREHSTLICQLDDELNATLRELVTDKLEALRRSVSADVKLIRKLRGNFWASVEG